MKKITVLNPATEKVLSEVPSAGPEEVHKAVTRAKKAYESWRKVPAHAGVLGLFLLVGFHHSASGVQEVIEDYISTPAMKKMALGLNTLLHLAAFGAGMAAIVSLMMKG